MSALRDLLDGENNEARREGRKWTACLVTDEKVTHVLVVTSSPALDLPIHRQLEAGLKAMGIRYEISVPMPI